MSDSQTKTAPSLGATALEVWRAWRMLGSIPQHPMSIQGQCELGCVGWTIGGMLQWEGPFNVPGHDFTCEPVTQEEEDKIWNCLLEGSLQIERRWRAPSKITHTPTKGDKKADFTVLHEATHEPLPEN